MTFKKQTFSSNFKIFPPKENLQANNNRGQTPKIWNNGVFVENELRIKLKSSATNTELTMVG